MNAMVFDSETCNGYLENGKLYLDNSLVYDGGWSVINYPTGEVLVERSYAIKEIFCDERELMKSAYYANKLPQYWQEIWNGTRKIATLNQVRKQLLEDIATFGVEIFAAHNARFDLNALNQTERYVTKSKYRYFLPYGLQVIDTLALARKAFGKDEDYIGFCRAYGYMTKHKTPQPRLTAEVLYRYLTKDTTFEESHTGLEDTQIEREILMECLHRLGTL